MMQRIDSKNFLFNREVALWMMSDARIYDSTLSCNIIFAEKSGKKFYIGIRKIG